MSRGKHLSLEEARKEGKLDQYAEEHPMVGRRVKFDRTLMTDPDPLTIWVLCEYCGGEGVKYTGHQNDPFPKYVGPCQVCNGSGTEEVEANPITMEDLDNL
jgi:hypothetical protein